MALDEKELAFKKQVIEAVSLLDDRDSLWNLWVFLFQNGLLLKEGAGTANAEARLS